MEVDQNKIEMWRHWERDRVGVTSMQEGYFAGWLAAQRTYGQALAAAEAECAEWRELGMCEECDDFSDVPAVLANDATRARLGLGRIGEAR
jgi:hypothetical protein